MLTIWGALLVFKLRRYGLILGPNDMKFILLFLEFPEYWTSGIIANYISEHAHILSHFDQEG